MKASIPTPQIGHLTSDDYEEVYEPAEDSFILLDALEKHAEELRDLRPSLCVEIGSGSGIVSSFIHALLKPWSSCIISTDINVKANGATIRTAKANGAALDAVRASLVDGLRIHGLIDLFVFNPPYVPTDEVELTDTQAEKGIGGAWAGGDDGMLVTNRVLEILPSLLSPQGRFYLVAIDQNKPQSIIDKMSDLGLAGQVVLKRRAGGELLSVICFTRS